MPIFDQSAHEDALREKQPVITPAPDDFIQAKARAMLAVYRETWDAKWRSQFDILEVEKEFVFPLLNPETEAASRSFVEAGKLDVLARDRSSGRLVVIEHKTASDPIDPASDYWDRLRMDTQCSKYFLAAAHFGHDVDGIIYDVLRKPLQRPSQIPLLDDDGLKIVLDSAGNRVFTKDGKKPRETADAEKGYVLQSRPETPAEYEARVLLVLRASPSEFFAHREVPRLNSDLVDYMADAWAVGQQLLYHRSKQLWPRNPQACRQFGTCEYFDLCCGRASVDGVRYSKPLPFAANPHKELTVQKGPSDQDLLTASRTTAFRKCPRFHKLRYEDCVERVDDEGREALTFGTIIHKGLEDYFNSLKQQTQ